MIHALRRIIDAVKSESNFNNALQILVRLVKQTLSGDVASVFLFDDSLQSYILSATDGLNQSAVGVASLQVDEGLVGLVGQREEPINLAVAHAHPNFMYVESTGEEAFTSFLSAPLIDRKKVLGVIVVQRASEGKFSAADERFLLTLSAQIAGVLVALNARSAVFSKLEASESNAQNRFFGTKVAGGIGIGQACVIQRELSFEAIEEKRIDDLKSEIASFETACFSLRDDLFELKKQVCDELESKDLALFDVYINMLEDDAFVGEVARGIQDGYWAATSLKRVVNSTLESFRSLDDHYFRARAFDIEDLGLKLLDRLLQTEQKKPSMQGSVILVGDDISATTLLEWPRESLAGVISLKGTSNSHMAIIARAIELPAIVGISDFPLQSLQGETIILDGFRGEVIVNPSAKLKDTYQAFLSQERRVLEGFDAEHDQPAKTLCGVDIKVLANTGFLADAKLALQRGARGVGLFRTEISFMSFDSFPSEEEQFHIYRQHLLCFSPYPVCMRTLDIGGDKALPYFPIHETNPFLGWRGLRVTLDHPEIFMVQIRAMLRASEGLENLQILLPMVSCVDEVDEALRLIHRAFQELTAEGCKIVIPKIGVMLEVPAAVMMAKAFADRVDFLSVGTNDLIQYLLAVDRNNPKVADLYHAFHPAVIQTLSNLAQELRNFNIGLSVCGEIAGDAALAALLVGMGYRTLSMSASSMLRVKWVLRRLTLSDMEELVDIAKKYQTSTECRSAVLLRMGQLGIGEVIHQGIERAAVRA